MSDDATLEISIFLEAIQKQPGDELTAYLDGACGGDPELRQVVEALVEKHHQGESFLERPAIAVDQTVDVNRSALDAGLAPAFGADEAVVVGSTGHSVLKSLSKSLRSVPHVSLHDSREDRGPMVQPASPELPTKDDDSRYQLLGEIARGGMGAIIKGRDTDLGRDLAIKVLLDSHKDKPDVIQRFVEEAQIGGQLQHPGIVPVYELGQFGDQRPFFSMKLVKGQTLAAILSKRKNPALDHPHLLGIFEQVCQTMAYAHSKGVIHRDLKPANIMVGAFGEVQVMDWGLSKVLNQGGVADEERSLDRHRDVSVIETRRSGGSGASGEVGSQTQIGSVMGTPAYMPPEQALGEVDRLDERADVFGLGAILAEILTGKPPYVAPDSTQVFRMASRGKLDDCFARLDNCEAEQDLIQLAKTALSAEPGERMSDARELATEVKQHLEGVQERLREAEIGRAKAQTRRKLSVAIAALLALVAIGASFAASHFRSQREKQTRLATQNRQLADERLLLATKNEELAAANKQKRIDAEDRERLAESMRLAATSRAIESELPVQSVLLALEAVKVKGRDGSVPSAAHSALLSSLANLGGDSLGGHGHKVTGAAVSPDGRWLMTGSREPRLWDLTNPNPVSTRRILPLPKAANVMQDAQFSSDSRWLFTGFNSLAIGWDLNAEEPSSAPLVFGDVNLRTQVAVSPDGHWLATGDGMATRKGGSVRIWDLTSNDPTTSFDELYRGRDAILDVDFSPDGRWLAAAGEDKTCRLWDFSKSAPHYGPLVLEGHTDQVVALAFSPDSRWLVTGSLDETARLWDLADSNPGQRPHVLDSHQAAVRAVSISPDGQWLATGCGDTVVRVWQLQDGRPVSRRVLIGHQAAIYDVRFSPDRRWLATASLDNSARIWDLEGSNLEASSVVLRGHDAAVTKVRFTPDGQSLVTISWDGTARLWDLASTNPASHWVLRGHAASVGGLRFTDDGRWLVSSDRERAMRLWNFANGTVPRRSVELGTGGNLSTSPDSRWLAAATTDGTIGIWDLTAPNVAGSRRQLSGHSARLWETKFSPDGRWLVSSSYDHTARFWRMTETGFGDCITLDVHSDIVAGIDFSSDGQWFATASLDGAVRLWDFETLTNTGDTTPALELPTCEAPYGAKYVRFSEDGRHLIAFCIGGPGFAWDLHAEDVRESVVPFEGHDFSVVGMELARGGTTAVTISWSRDSIARLWPLALAPKSIDLRGHAGYLSSLAVDPSGRWVVTGAEDKTARLWDVSSDDPSPTQLVLRGHGSTVGSVAFSPEGRWIVTGSADLTIRIWPRDLGGLVELAQRTAGRELTPAERERYGLAKVARE